jgi:large subunit ribosomal protein L23
MKGKHEIIKGPVMTEKASTQMAGNKYSFRVNQRANKIAIKRAVEEAFKVTVTDVNTATMRGKNKRVRWQIGKTPDWKKAIVTLKEGDKIEYAQ